MWTLALIPSLLLSAPPAVAKPIAELFPCTPGLEVTYRLAEGTRSLGTVTERVKGQGKEPRTCVLERSTHYTGRRPRREARP